MTDDRLLTAARKPEDVDAALRPKSLDEFVGQKAARENLRVFVQAARARGDALDHVLFFGPPGLGKTTLYSLIGSGDLPSSKIAGRRLIATADLLALLERNRTAGAI